MLLEIARNSSFLLGAQVVERLAAYGLLIYITRTFGSAFFGTYVTVVTFLSLAGYIIDFGLANLIIREVAQQPAAANRCLGGLFPLRLGLGLAGILVMQLVVQLGGYPEEIAALALLACPAVLLGVPGGLLSAGLSGLGKIHVAAICGVAGTLVTAGFSIALLSAGFGLPGVFTGWIAAAAVSWGITTLAADRAGIRLRPRWDVPFLRGALREVWPFAVLTLTLVTSGVDILLLARWHGTTSVGLYSAARRPLEILLFIPGSLMTALYPVLASQYAQGSDLPWRIYLRTVQFLSSLAVPLAVGAVLLRERWVVLLYGEAFRPAAEVVPVLAFTLLVAFLGMPATQIIFSARRTREFVPFFVANSAASVLWSALLIGPFGARGAGAALCLSMLGGFWVQRDFIRKIFGRSPVFARLLWRPALAGLAMAAGLWSFVAAPLSIVVPLGAAVYGGVLWMLRGYRQPLEAGRGR